MDWILLIFNKFIVLTFWLAISCASQESNKMEQSNESLDQELGELDSKTGAFVWGPTKKVPNPLFKNQTKKYGLEGIQAQYFNIIDFNNDGYSDLVLLKNYFSNPDFYVFLPKKKKFKKVASLFKEPISASYLLFYDFDNDDIVDALAGVLNQKSELTKKPLSFYKGRMVNGKLEFGDYPYQVDYLPAPSATVVPLDYDLDGDLDLFIGNWFKYKAEGPIPMPDILLKNDEGNFKRKTNILREENKSDESKRNYLNATPTFSASVCDVDQNGYPDIITASSSRFANKLWLNLRGKKQGRFFKDYGLISGMAQDNEGLVMKRGGGRTFFSSCADYNNDTVIDLFMAELSHHYDSDSVDKSALLTGKWMRFPPKFLRTEYISDARSNDWSEGDRRAIWFDYNNDGLLDILIDNSGFPPHSRLILFEQLPDHSFVNRSQDLGIDILNPLNTVTADFNQDGKMDILTSQSTLRSGEGPKGIYLFENNYPDSGKSIRLFFDGKKANKLGIGAMVILKIKKDNEIQFKRRWVSYSEGSLPPQHETGIHIGLDFGEKPLSILVRWPFAKDKEILKKVYNISHLKLKKSQNMTLCDDGQFYLKKTSCR